MILQYSYFLILGSRTVGQNLMERNRENFVRVLPIGILLIFLTLYLTGYGNISSSSGSNSAVTNLLRVPQKLDEVPVK